MGKKIGLTTYTTDEIPVWDMTKVAASMRLDSGTSVMPFQMVRQINSDVTNGRIWCTVIPHNEKEGKTYDGKTIVPDIIYVEKTEDGKESLEIIENPWGPNLARYGNFNRNNRGHSPFILRCVGAGRIFYGRY